MCFSAEASFTLSAVLMVTGVAAVNKAVSPRQLMFAGIPLIFSVQQCTEGILWMSLTGAGNAQWQMPGTYFFLLFAMVVWPVWVPLSFLLMEKEAKRKKTLFVILAVGALLSVYMIYCLFTYRVNCMVTDHHLHYDLQFPYYLRWFSSALYFLPTVVSPFISSEKKTWMLGWLVLAAHIVSRLFFHDYILSVWCFLAAVISVVVLRKCGR